jgi:hypothetical protein
MPASTRRASLTAAAAAWIALSASAASAAGVTLQATVNVDKCPGDASITVISGSDVVYCYDIGNPDALTTLTEVRVFDDQSGADPVARIATLAPGARQMLTHTKVFLNRDTISFVTVRAVPLVGGQPLPEVSATDSVQVDVQ